MKQLKILACMSELACAIAAFSLGTPSYAQGVYASLEGKLLDSSRGSVNLLNSLNVRFFNTVYGASDFCPANPAASGCAGPANNREGSPNQLYGSPRSVFNPRQIQLALKFEF